MTLTVQSVRSFGFGGLIEQILGGPNIVLIGPQENVSLTTDQASKLHKTKSYIFSVRLHFVMSSDIHSLFAHPDIYM